MHHHDNGICHCSWMPTSNVTSADGFLPFASCSSRLQSGIQYHLNSLRSWKSICILVCHKQHLQSQGNCMNGSNISNGCCNKQPVVKRRTQRDVSSDAEGFFLLPHNETVSSEETLPPSHIHCKIVNTPCCKAHVGYLSLKHAICTTSDQCRTVQKQSGCFTKACLYWLWSWSSPFRGTSIR